MVAVSAAPSLKGRETASLVKHHTALAALSASQKLMLYASFAIISSRSDLFTRANSLDVDEPRALAVATRVSEKPPIPHAGGPLSKSRRNPLYGAIGLYSRSTKHIAEHHFYRPTLDEGQNTFSSRL
ncbi:hypothetical protein GMOD_00008344 [Pyrenophora seminiperda CCB06]|uniref:Uncharacterized protein n=1 Tax=Pyrenophora seminiperda CCB06 TaxID=1302712 RepID=A0A3M7M2E1_9PLEO|nr:hypothetical protein GMOD_00008344 [Pyrenophora seminiperda CCB06]